MTLFKVDIDKKIAEELQPTKFKTLDLWERKDIQEWVKDNPGLIEEDILILSSEFDQFDKTKERLDVLGIKKVTGSDGSSFGRLVVVELKRDSDKTHALQALQYAAFVSRFTVDDVVSFYASWEGIEEDEARIKLAKFLGADPTDGLEIDSKPMVILLAQRFRNETTTTVMWLLEELELDISCVRLVPYEIEGKVYVQTDKIIPLPEAEQYRMARQNKEASKKPGKRKQGANVLNALIENDLLGDGDVLKFSQARIPAEFRTNWPPEREELSATLSITGEAPQLEWANPETGETETYAISRLASMILAMVKGEPWSQTSAGVQGVEYWELDGKRLKALAAEKGLTSGGSAKFNTEDVRQFCLSIPEGKWTSYWAAANALGSPNGAQSVSGILAGFDDSENPHRVLRKNGEIPEGWGSTSGQQPTDCRERLEAEGVTFGSDGRANIEHFWEPDSIGQYESDDSE